MITKPFDDSNHIESKFQIETLTHMKIALTSMTLDIVESRSTSLTIHHNHISNITIMINIVMLE